MKINKKGTSIVEAVVAMFIIVTGVVGMYRIYITSTRLESSTSNKTVGIAIAREGIEAMTNIRDTNWLLFSSNSKDCWNTFNYNINCVSDNTNTLDINSALRYKIYKNSENRWELASTTPITSDYLDATYRTNFRVGLDSDGFFTQSGATSELRPFYTREIIVNYIDTGAPAGADSNDEKMEITSLVQWLDSSSKEAHKVELKTVLSNWKE